jgi:serine/threonine protein kinase
VKVIDFDTLCEWSPKTPASKEVLGTDQYIAQEAYAGQYSPLSDVFAVGVIAYKLLTGRFPFRAEIFDDQPGENWVGSPKMAEIRGRLKRERVEMSDVVFNRNPEARDLVAQMLSCEEHRRPTAALALSHAFLKDSVSAGPKDPETPAQTPPKEALSTPSTVASTPSVERAKGRGTGELLVREHRLATSTSSTTTPSTPTSPWSTGTTSTPRSRRNLAAKSKDLASGVGRGLSAIWLKVRQLRSSPTNGSSLRSKSAPPCMSPQGGAAPDKNIGVGVVDIILERKADTVGKAVDKARLRARG